MKNYDIACDEGMELIDKGKKAYQISEGLAEKYELSDRQYEMLCVELEEYEEKNCVRCIEEIVKVPTYSEKLAELGISENDFFVA